MPRSSHPSSDGLGRAESGWWMSADRRRGQGRRAGSNEVKCMRRKEGGGNFRRARFDGRQYGRDRNFM
eukprot:2667878-Pleurochrysis_carterae.AAC.1